MRAAVLVVLGLLAAGCPSSQNPNSGGTPDAAPPIDGPGSGSGTPACTFAKPTCTTTIRYHGTGSTVSLRGDFAADGWTTGVAMTKNPDGSFEATIPANDEQVILYKFVVDGTWMADPANPLGSPDGYGASNSVLRVDCDMCPARPATDWRDGIMYFIMIDRFANGDPSNDRTVPGVTEAPAQYQGGDFVGITQKIDGGYFDALGVNTLWITSPLDNADNANPGADGHMYSGYHGYWPADLTKTESHYGTEDELKTMVAHAHAHGINVLVDYVMNHVHDTSPTYAAHHDWFWADSNGSGGNCVCGAGCSWDTDRLRCWFDTFLPDFNFTVGDARRWSVDNAISWAKRLGIDGFRLDAVKHVETSWLTDLRARANAELAFDQRFYMVGETFDGSRDLIKSYVNADTMLDGQFDFPLRGTILSNILRRDGAMSDLAGFVATNDTFYGSGSVMSTFIGNHDVPRAIGIADDSPMFGAWDGGKDRAWTNQPNTPGDANPYQRIAVAYTFLMTSPGLPMIYYGDEVGMPGAGDPDNRRFMQWDNYSANQTFLHDRIAALAKLRTAHPATRRGTRTQLGSNADVFVYKMTAPSDTVFVALNRGDSAQQAIGLPAGDYVDLISGQPVHAPVSIAPRSGLVLGVP